MGLAGWLLVYAAIQIFSWYNSLGESLQAGIIAAIPIIIVAVVGYFANKSLETKRSVELAMRPKKIELYDEFIKFIMSIFNNQKVTKPPSDDEMLKFFIAKTPVLMTFASNAVIEKWGRLRTGLGEDGLSNERKLFMVEELFKEIRRDLGHSGRGFHKGDILRLFINDIDEHLKK